MSRSKALAAIVLLGGAVLVCWSCAKRGAPPGGPVDSTAPHVSGILPPSGSVSVGIDSPISVTFSESMKKRTVETGIVVSPPCRWKKRYWQENAYHMVPESGLKPNTTYLISISHKVQDRHGVAMKSTFVSGFSTGDSINAGIISGKVVWKKMTVEAALVELFDADAVDTLGGFTAVTPLYVTLSGPGGLYEIPFVDTGVRYSVLAFIDEDLNLEYDEGEDVGCHYGVLGFDGAQVLGDINVTICGDVAGGGISGAVDTATVADTLKVSILARSVSDSGVVYSVSPRSDGGFDIGCVTPGLYVIEAFVDRNGNLKRDVEDTISVELPDTIGVESCSRSPLLEFRFNHED
jgi:hypothetical protein